MIIKEGYGGRWVCYFCGRPLPKKGVSKHHIEGKKNSDEWKPAHKNCHQKYHHRVQLDSNKKQISNEKKWGWRE